MKIEISDEQYLHSISSFFPYMFSVTESHVKKHTNDVLTAYLIDGNKNKEFAVSKNIQDRRKISEKAIKAIRARRMIPGNSFVAITITINTKNDNSPRNFITDVASSIGETVEIWAQLFDEITCIAYHLDEISDKENKTIYPHIHVTYPKHPDDPNKLKRWLQNTILDKQNKPDKEKLYN